MSNTFNPSLGARMKQFPKTDFGLVVCMPFLPVASEEFKSRPVMNQEDGCIYRSVLIDKTWVWEKTTNGVFRQYIFSTLPVVEDQPTIEYVSTEDTVPQPGARYYVKNSDNRFVKFMGTEFEEGVTYYSMVVTTHGYTFDDVVDTVNSLLAEFKRWRVTFVNAPASGKFENATYRDIVLILNEMIDHVNRYSNYQLVPYSGEGDIDLINLTTTVMDDLVEHLNNLISAVNPYVNVLTDLQRAIATLADATIALQVKTSVTSMLDALETVNEPQEEES